MDLKNYSKLYLRQRRELAELFGFETRNKYEITDGNKNQVAFATEQQKGVFGFLLRQLLGHWRTFEIHVFDSQFKPVLIAKQPFRFIFQRLEVSLVDGSFVGALQQRFAFFSKRFDVQDSDGRVIFEMSSPIWRIWTFPFRRQNSQTVEAQISKKWTGLLNEAFTDQDHFQIEFSTISLSNSEKLLILAAGLFIDLRYFERKAGSGA